MQPLKQSILKVIAYFDLFDYPVTADEIKFFLGQPFKEAGLLNELQELQDNYLLYKMNNFYSLRHDYSLVKRRINGNNGAAKRLKLAAKIARFLSWFPYIRGVAVSGSLSKNFAYKGSDIDFFIITEPNRLWIARTLFVFFHKVATLVGLKNWFCLNYFIDTTATEIPEKNIYTAIEIATLMPMQGKAVFEDFYKSNKWIYNYLPNCLPGDENTAERKAPFFKRLTEWLFNNKTGDKLENYLMHFYRERWKKLLDEKKFAKTGFQLGSYIAGPHVCKPIPHNFQGKLLTRFEEKMKGLDNIYYPSQSVAV